MVSKVTSTGFIQKVDNFQSRYPDYDSRSGEHCWIVINSYKVNPNNWLEGGSILGPDNLLGVEGPGCYFCEQPYTPLLASRRCKGEPK